MAFKNLKITCINAEGKCSRTKVGSTFTVRNAKLEIPAGQTVCIFALGSILQPITGAMVNNKDGEGILDVLTQWQCPDPLANVVFKIEEEKMEP